MVFHREKHLQTSLFLPLCALCLRVEGFFSRAIFVSKLKRPQASWRSCKGLSDQVSSRGAAHKMTPPPTTISAPSASNFTHVLAVIRLMTPKTDPKAT